MKNILNLLLILFCVIFTVQCGPDRFAYDEVGDAILVDGFDEQAAEGVAPEIDEINNDISSDTNLDTEQDLSDKEPVLIENDLAEEVQLTELTEDVVETKTESQEEFSSTIDEVAVPVPGPQEPTETDQIEDEEPAQEESLEAKVEFTPYNPVEEGVLVAEDNSNEGLNPFDAEDVVNSWRDKIKVAEAEDDDSHMHFNENYKILENLGIVYTSTTYNENTEEENMHFDESSLNDFVAEVENTITTKDYAKHFPEDVMDKYFNEDGEQEEAVSLTAVLTYFNEDEIGKIAKKSLKDD